MKIKSLTGLMGLTLLAGLGMAACVWRTEHKIETVSTINAHIVLDIRQEASQIEDYVREPANAPADGAKKEPVSYGGPQKGGMSLAINSPARAWYNLTTVSYAAQGMAKVTEGELNAAKERRKTRYPAVNASLVANRVGENDHGYLSVIKSGDEGAAGTSEQLVKADNADREIIYRSIAESKGLDDSQIGAIEQLFAEVNRDQLAAGMQFQAPKDDEFFKKFKASALGQRFPDAKPGAWLTK